MENLPKLNYGDFYKFITSFSLVLFIFGTSAITFIINFMPEGGWKIFLIIFYISFSILSVLIFIWVLNNWWKKQKILDKIEQAKLSKLEAETINVQLGRSTQLFKR